MATKQQTYEVTLTESAAKKITELQKHDNMPGYGLKLYLYPGGCSGFQYGMDFAEQPADTDIVMEQHGVKLFVDSNSLDFLRGSRIDYKSGLHESGFKIDNPNVKSTCGCGKSVC